RWSGDWSSDVCSSDLHGGIQVRDGLHGLDGPEAGVRVERGADLGELHEHDVAQLALRVVGDAHAESAVAQVADVLVVLGVAQVQIGRATCRETSEVE